MSGLLLMLAGCAGEPARHANLADTVQGVAPSAWSVAAPQQALDVDAWWQDFGDPVLHALIASVRLQVGS